MEKLVTFMLYLLAGADNPNSDEGGSMKTNGASSSKIRMSHNKVAVQLLLEMATISTVDACLSSFKDLCKCLKLLNLDLNGVDNADTVCALRYIGERLHKVNTYYDRSSLFFCSSCQFYSLRLNHKCTPTDLL